MPVRSPHPDVEIPAVSFPEFLFGRGLGEHVDLPAFVDGTTGAVLTHGGLHEQGPPPGSRTGGAGDRTVSVESVHPPMIEQLPVPPGTRRLITAERQRCLGLMAP